MARRRCSGPMIRNSFPPSSALNPLEGTRPRADTQQPIRCIGPNIATAGQSEFGLVGSTPIGPVHRRQRTIMGPVVGAHLALVSRRILR